MIMTRVLRHMKVSTIWHVVSGFTSSERPSKIVPFTCIPSLSSTVSLEFPWYTGNILREGLESRPRLSLLMNLMSGKSCQNTTLRQSGFMLICISWDFFTDLTTYVPFKSVTLHFGGKIYFTVSSDSHFTDLT